MYKLNRHSNLSQATTLPEGLTMPLMRLLTSTIEVSGGDIGFHSSSLHCVCHLNADSYSDLSPKQIYRIHENEKKRQYDYLVTEIEQGTLIPLVFTTTAGMADECLRYHTRLAELLSAKKQESYATTIP